MLVLMGIFGAALLYGDGMITPAITVLGAVEGLKVATPLFEPYVVPIAVGDPHRCVRDSAARHPPSRRAVRPDHGCLVPRHRGARHLWLVEQPVVLTAVDPRHAVRVLSRARLARLRRARRRLPGRHRRRGALRRHGPLRQAADSPRLVRARAARAAAQLLRPGRAAAEQSGGGGSSRSSCWRRTGRSSRWWASPLPRRSSPRRRSSPARSRSPGRRSSSATARASTSSTPRRTRSARSTCPQVNWALMVSTIAIVIGFGSSTALAAAYGIAVTLTMVITAVLLHVVATERWRWPPAVAFAVTGVFLTVDLAFFGANALKIAHGGWLPLVIGALLFTLMTTWKTGRQIVAQRLTARAVPLEEFMARVADSRPARVPGHGRLHDRAAARHPAGTRAQPALQQGAARARRHPDGDHAAGAPRARRRADHRPRAWPRASSTSSYATVSWRIRTSRRRSRWPGNAGSSWTRRTSRISWEERR